MAAVRNELAKANAQALMNVCPACLYLLSSFNYFTYRTRMNVASKHA